MLNLSEIEDEIVRLEHSNTTYSNCEKLSVLYTIMNQHKPNDDIPMYSYASAPESEFVQTAKAATQEKILKVFDDHMESLKILYPKTYESILSKLRSG